MQEKQQEKQNKKKKKKVTKIANKIKQATPTKQKNTAKIAQNAKQFNHKARKILQNTHQIVILVANICPFVVVFKS